MAFTKAPMENTEQTKQIPLLYTWDNRSPSDPIKDTVALNVVWDIVQNQATGDGYFQATKREGLSKFNSDTIPSTTNGIFYWAENDQVVACGDYGVRGYNTSGTLIWSSATVTYTDSVGHIGFTNFAFENGTNNLIITDGNDLVTVNAAGTVTVITDADRPVIHQPYPVFLDGYLFLCDDKGNIQNSDLNNPSSWTAGNFISAEAYADKVIAIARHGVYIVAFGTSSIEFFYDAANPTGTPLAKQSSTTPRIGYAGGLASYGDSLYFIGQPSGGFATVCRISGLKVEIIGTPTSDRQIEGTMISTGTTQDFQGYVYAINGHVLYSWFGNNLHTYAYDITTGFFSELKSDMSNSTGFNPRASTDVSRPPLDGKPFSLVVWSSQVGNDLYAFRETIYQDNGTNFDVQFTTKNMDFGTRRVKFGTRLLLLCDQTATSSNISISWTDDDYQTFSTARTVDISNRYPVLYALGSFRKRAFKVVYTANFPMRFQMMELDYQQGQA